MKHKVKQIANISTGSYFSLNPEANAYYLQSRDFDSDGNYVETLNPTIKIDESNKNQLEEHDILLVAKGNNFNAYLFKQLDEPAIASSVFLTIRCNPNMVNPAYLHWFLNIETTQSLLKTVSKGTSIPSINKKTLEEIEIPLPDLNEQHKILAFAQLAKREKQLMQTIIQKKSALNESILLNKLANN